jgi:hypothetical protein
MEINKLIKILAIAIGVTLLLTIWNTIRIETLRSSLYDADDTELVEDNGTKKDTKSKKSKINKKYNVDINARVENRYLVGTAPTPVLPEAEVGAVEIEIVVNKKGKVTRVTIDNGTTITNERILQACKEAALQTQFSKNPDASDRTTGAITYKITKK